MKASASTFASARRQRGSMAVTIMLLMLGLLAILGLVEVGYVFWAKRDAQKIADLAALAGAQQLSACAIDNSDNSTARNNAVNQNHFSGSVQIACGVWDPTAKATDGSIPSDHFFPNDPATTNAVRVIATRPFVPFFGFTSAMNITARAVATNKGPPIAAFSIGSTLASVNTANSALLNPLLGSTLGTSLGLNLLSYKGLAGLNVNLLGLTDALNLHAATVDGVLDSPVKIGDLLDATVTSLQSDKDNNLANVDLALIKQQIASIKAVLGDTTVNLGDVLDVNADTSDPNTALDADIGVSDLINASLQAANHNHAVQAAVPVNLGSLGNVNLKLSVIEPPKIGVGYPKKYMPPGAQAHTAQVRIGLMLNLLNATGSGSTLADLNLALVHLKLSAPAGQALQLPLNLELAPATGTLDDVRCYVPTNPTSHEVDITAAPGIANAFVGNLPKAYDNASNGTSWANLVNAAVADKSAFANLLSLHLDVSALLGLIPIASGDMSLRAYINVPATTENSTSAANVFFKGVNPNVPVNQQNLTANVGSGNALLGTVKNGLLTPGNIVIDSNAIQNLSIAGLNANQLGNVINFLIGSINTLTSFLITTLGNVLAPVFNTLDANVLGPLLDLLGINPANADVTLTDVQCHSSAQLVY